ncbi:MAG TPA: hypothetical protein VEW07_01065 [Solirubrobacterales bacterium]|nr:hypothetical protein [Solirubrobacterales bacterium]
MLRGGRIALLVALCALTLTPLAGGQVGGQLSPADRYWLGPYFAGLELTSTDGSFSYGTCELPEGEGGCPLPVQVQTTTSCARNPIGLDRIPYEVYLVRGGGLAAGYESTAVDVGTGGQTVTVYTESEVVGAALREIRPRSQPAPQPAPQPLAPPVYPLPVLRELVRVTAVAGRLGGIGAIAKATDLPPDEVRLRLRIAELLGPGALAGVPAPTMSTATVERLRQLAFRTQYNPRKSARRLGISVASLRKKIGRVRGLTGYCG